MMNELTSGLKVIKPIVCGLDISSKNVKVEMHVVDTNAVRPCCVCMTLGGFDLSRRADHHLTPSAVPVYDPQHSSALHSPTAASRDTATLWSSTPTPLRKKGIVWRRNQYAHAGAPARAGMPSATIAYELVPIARGCTGFTIDAQAPAGCAPDGAINTEADACVYAADAAAREVAE